MNDIVAPPTNATPISKRGEPAWEIAMLFPAQGDWCEEAYLALDTNHRVELANGFIEVHPMPSMLHQLIAGFLYRWLEDFIRQHRLGLVLYAPFPVRMLPSTYREPDVVFLKQDRIPGRTARSVVGADLVIEVVSEGTENRKRDLETKPAEYAAAGISEYWIIDPELQTITVLALDGAAYRTRRVFRMGDTATSLLLPGLSVAVQDVFAAGTAIS
jgi:Uma2 family endonuclease